MKLRKTKSKEQSRPAWMMPAPDRPSFTDNIRFPENITALTSKEVGMYHGRYVALNVYAIAELSKVTVRILRLESELDELFSDRALVMPTGLTHRDKEAIISSQPTIRKKNRELLAAKVQKERINSYVVSFEKYAAALSRELSRRAAEVKQY